MANTNKNCADNLPKSTDKDHLSRDYDDSFIVSKEYRESLPDMQNANARHITGSNVPILKVGISNFNITLRSRIIYHFINLVITFRYYQKCLE